MISKWKFAWDLRFMDETGFWSKITVAQHGKCKTTKQLYRKYVNSKLCKGETKSQAAPLLHTVTANSACCIVLLQCVNSHFHRTTVSGGGINDLVYFIISSNYFYLLFQDSKYESIKQTAWSIAEHAQTKSFDPDYMSPFAKQARLNGYNSVKGIHIFLFRM